jgi:hypothetical protein
LLVLALPTRFPILRPYSLSLTCGGGDHGGGLGGRLTAGLAPNAAARAGLLGGFANWRSSLATAADQLSESNIREESPKGTLAEPVQLAEGEV